MGVGLLSASQLLIPDITFASDPGFADNDRPARALHVLQRENRLPDLAPERYLIAAKPFENSIIEVGQTKEAARELASTRIAPGLEDFDNFAHFSG